MYFFFNHTATTEIYTLSLHDALPILVRARSGCRKISPGCGARPPGMKTFLEDRKSTRLNSSHANISYAVFCLKKKTLVARGGSDPARRRFRLGALSVDAARPAPARRT